MKSLLASLGLVAVFGIGVAAPTAFADPINDVSFFDTIPHSLITWELDGNGDPNPVLSNITLPFDEYDASGLTIAPVSPGIRLMNDTSPQFHVLQAIGGSNPYGLSARSQDTGSLNFDLPVRSFGFFFLDILGRDATFSARDASDALIETVVFNGSFVDGSGSAGPNTIEFGFIGITSNTPIHRVEVTAISGLIDNLHFSPLPEPTTLTCLLLGASALTVRRWRRSPFA